MLFRLSDLSGTILAQDSPNTRQAIDTYHIVITLLTKATLEEYLVLCIHQ